MGRPEDHVGLNVEADPLQVVLVLDEKHHGDEDRDHDEDDPGALVELRDRDDHDHHARHDRADPVDQGTPAPARSALGEPVPDHTRLRQREGREDTDSVEADQGIGRSVEGDDQEYRHQGQGDDPGVEGQPLAAQGELARKVAVPGQDGGEARKVGEARLGRQDQDAHRGDLEDVVERATAGENRSPDLRQDGLPDPASASRVSADAHGQIARAKEHDPQQRGHDDHRLLGVLPLHRLECRNSVRHGLGASHGRAAVRECLAEQEQPHALCCDTGQGRDVVDLGKLACQRPEDADGDEQQHRADEDVGRAGEQGAALPQPAQVHDHDQQDRRRDELNGPRLKRRKGRIEGLDAG